MDPRALDIRETVIQEAGCVTYDPKYLIANTFRL